MVLIILPVLLIISVTLTVILVLRNAGNVELTQEARQYYAGSVIRIPQGAVLTRSDGKSVIEYGKTRRDATNLFLYYQSGNAVVLPQDVAYNDPRRQLMGKLDYFTQLNYKSGGAVSVSRRGITRSLGLGFLYDGSDTYLFLEPMTLKYNNYEIELSALSFAEAQYGGRLTVYNRETGEVFDDIPVGEVNCVAPGEDYTVSLLNDLYVRADGTRLLLYTDPSGLESVFAQTQP
jgi:hypothetical protein